MRMFRASLILVGIVAGVVVLVVVIRALGKRLPVPKTEMIGG